MEQGFNFAIVKSMFGDIWIGRTKLQVRAGAIFSDYDDALEEAKESASYQNVVDMESVRDNDEIEDIQKDVERFII